MKKSSTKKELDGNTRPVPASYTTEDGLTQTMALRFGPKQAIDAFLPAPAAETTPVADTQKPDPREPPHPDQDAAVEARSTAPRPDPPERPFGRSAPGPGRDD